MVAVIALIILAIAIVTGIIAVLMIRKRKKEGKPQAEYRTFFILGVTCGMPPQRIPLPMLELKIV